MKRLLTAILEMRPILTALKMYKLTTETEHTNDLLVVNC